MSNQNIKEIKDSDGNVKFRIAKIGVFDTSPTPLIEDLVKRIESLEKQLVGEKLTTSYLLTVIQKRIREIEVTLQGRA
ncbi:TPA: hypothetical protein ACKRET_003436 [Proteus mirabilis]